MATGLGFAGVIIDIEGGLREGAMLLEGTVTYQAQAASRAFRGSWTLLDDGVCCRFLRISGPTMRGKKPGCVASRATTGASSRSSSGCCRASPERKKRTQGCSNRRTYEPTKLMVLLMTFCCSAAASARPDLLLPAHFDSLGPTVKMLEMPTGRKFTTLTMAAPAEWCPWCSPVGSAHLCE